MADTAEPTYQLTLSEQQARLVRDALDLYSRVHIGQLECVAGEYQFSSAVPSENAHCLADCLRGMKRLLGKLEFAGIHSPDVSDRARQAYDIVQVIRHRLALDLNPQPDDLDRLGIDYDQPRRTSALPLPTMTQIEPNKENVPCINPKKKP